MGEHDKKKVTEYLNRITHKYDKDGRIMPFQIEWNLVESTKYIGLTKEEKIAVCTLFLKNPADVLFSDVCDIRDFPVLLKDAVYIEKGKRMNAEIPEKDIAPAVDPRTITSNEGFNDAFMNFMAQRDEMVKPKEPAPLQLDLEGFGEDDSEFGDYQSVFSKENIYTSQIFEVKPKDLPVSHEDAMKRYNDIIANSISETEAVAQFNRMMKEKQDAFDAEKNKYNEKLGEDSMLALAKARDAEFVVPNYAEEERKKAYEAMMRDQEEMKKRIEEDKERQRRYLETVPTNLSSDMSGNIRLVRMEGEDKKE